MSSTSMLRRSAGLTVVLILIAVGVLWTTSHRDPASAQEAAPPAEGEPELAAYMMRLQYYSHKLMLSAHAQNAPLADFYLHELEETTETVAEQVPQYEGYAIGELVNAMLVPRVEALETSVDATDWTGISERIDALVDACNTCHEATDHGFIRIERTRQNPYTQSFQPR